MESDGAAVSRCVLSRRLSIQKGWPETSTARQPQTRAMQSFVQQAQNLGGLRLLTPVGLSPQLLASRWIF